MDEQRENLQPEQNEAAAQDAKKTERGWESLAFLHDMVYLLAIVTILFTFFFRLVLESNFLYRNVKQGDIVVLKVDYFDKPIVKRVIATGGQTVDIDFEQGIVYVDGAALDEDYVNEPTYKSYLEYGMGLDYPVEVPEGSVFVMGDNRNAGCC